MVVAFEEDETKTSVLPFAQKLGVAFPLFWDEGGKTLALWKVSMMPTGFVVGRTGKVSYVQRGYAPGDEATLEKSPTDALADKGS